MAWKRIEDGAEGKYLLEGAARFLVDENLNPEVARYLRKRGFNVRVATELRGHDDEDLLATALGEKRVLLTHDVGFLNRRRHHPSRNPGVVVLSGGYGDIQDLARAVGLLARHLSDRFILEGSYTEIRGSGLITITFRDLTGKMTTQRFRAVRGGIDLWEDD